MEKYVIRTRVYTPIPGIYKALKVIFTIAMLIPIAGFFADIIKFNLREEFTGLRAIAAGGVFTFALWYLLTDYPVKTAECTEDDGVFTFLYKGVYAKKMQRNLTVTIDKKDVTEMIYDTKKKCLTIKGNLVKEYSGCDSENINKWELFIDKEERIIRAMEIAFDKNVSVVGDEM